MYQNLSSSRSVLFMRAQFIDGLLCVDSKVRRKYEERCRSDRKVEDEALSDTSSDKSEGQVPAEDPREEEKKGTSCRLPPPNPLPLGKQPLAFKLDLSKCRFDRTKESPVDVELSMFRDFYKNREAECKRKETGHCYTEVATTTKWHKERRCSKWG